jgi:predicted ATPase
VTERVFVGRAREIERTAAIIDAVAAGRGALACFSGEAGIGKTRLATRVVDLAAERGFRIAWGRCWEAGGAPAYWPWTQVFEQLAIPDPFAGAAPGATDARELRFRTFDVAVRALVTAANDAPLAVVVDDLHAADLPSLELLRVLARGLSRARLLVIATYREVEARLAGEVGALLAKIGREGDVLALSRLSRDEVIAWIRDVAPGASAADAARVWDATEGNPLFVHEVLRTPSPLDVRRLPDGLHTMIEEHIARVDAELRDLLSEAAVLGREINVTDVVRTIRGECARAEPTTLSVAPPATRGDARDSRWPAR